MRRYRAIQGNAAVSANTAWFSRIAKYSRNAAASQSPGLAALSAAYPGNKSHNESTLKGLSADATLSGLTASLHPSQG